MRVAQAQAAVDHEEAVIALDQVLVGKAIAAENTALVADTGRSAEVGPWNNDPSVRAFDRLLIAQKSPLRPEDAALGGSQIENSQSVQGRSATVDNARLIRWLGHVPKSEFSAG